MDYSVLMSVYSGEKPAFLRQSMESMFCQTAPTNDFVLVCDGELTRELDSVIAEMHRKHPGTLTVVHLEHQSGLGAALNAGMKHCRNDLVARMDSDDISLPCRCSEQLAIFEKMPNVSMVSGFVQEFDQAPEIGGALRTVPETNKQIIRFAKRRCPFNHNCIMYRKSAVEAVGAYADFFHLEDYHLWVRLLAAGYEGYNIQHTLLKMRTGDMYHRRGGMAYARSQIHLCRFMRKTGFISEKEYVENSAMRVVSALMPSHMRKAAYSLFLRRQPAA